jgi:hypothetical protein
LDNDGQKYDLRVTCRCLRDVLDKMNGLSKENGSNKIGNTLGEI